MTNMKRVRVDKYTGKKLIPIQVWVDEKNHYALQKKARKYRMTLQSFLRQELEDLITKMPF